MTKPFLFHQGPIVKRADANDDGIKRFYSGKPCLHGHVAERLVSDGKCVECHKLKGIKRRSTPEYKAWAKEYSAIYRLKPEYKASIAKYQASKKHSVSPDKYRLSPRYKAQNAKYRSTPEYISKADVWHASYYASSKGKEVRKKYRASPECKATLVKYYATPKYKITQHIRRSIRRLLIGSKATTDAELGYTSSDLVRHLERQFTKGMTWENYGDAWEVDHINPIKWFLENGITDAAIVNALSNLRPLDKAANRAKSASRELLI